MQHTAIIHKAVFKLGVIDSQHIGHNIATEYALILNVMNGKQCANKLIFGTFTINGFQINCRQSRLPALPLSLCPAPLYPQTPAPPPARRCSLVKTGILLFRLSFPTQRTQSAPITSLPFTPFPPKNSARFIARLQTSKAFPRSRPTISSAQNRQIPAYEKTKKNSCELN